MSDSPTVDLLLRHGAFIQRLAHELVRDPHVADDLAQEARARWLEQGSAPLARPRAWLRRVLHNLSINRAAAEERRRRREELSARGEALPSAATDAAEAELLHAVSAAVLELDEPYRSTILARYYHGVDARRLAEDSDTPLATVRSREQRALARLRERLDRERGGRERWALALAGLGNGAKVVIPLWLAAACLAGSLGLWSYALWTRAAARELVAAPELASAAAPGPTAPEAENATEPAVASSSSTRAASSGVASAPARGASSLPSTATVPSLVKGRLVLADGSSAAQTLLRLEGSSGADSRSLETTSDEQGSFSLAFEWPTEFLVNLTTVRTDHASAAWSWRELSPGSVQDVGEVVLYRGGVVEGRLVDANGNPLSGAASRGWNVRVSSVGLRSHAGRSETVARAEVAEDGRFRVEGVHPGPSSIAARSAAAHADAPTFESVAGERVQLDLVHRGPDLTRRVTVLLTNDRAPLDAPQADNVRLLGSERRAVCPEDTAGAFVFDGVEPGSYTLVIDDPSCLPWRQDGVQPGVPVRAHVEGSAALALAVVAEDGSAVSAFEVRLQPHGNWLVPRDRVVHDGSAPLAGGVVTGIYPGDYTLSVRSAGRTLRARIDDLGPGEVRALTLRFEAPVRIGGRVLDAQQGPVPRARVRVIRPALVRDSDATPFLPPGGVTPTPERFRHELGRVETDASGAFRFEVSEPGSFLVEASMAETRVQSAVFALSAGATRDDLELVLAGSGALRGRVRGPSGAEYAGLALKLRPAGASSALGRLLAEPTLVPLASDGAFAVLDAPAGELEVWLALPAAPGGPGETRKVVPGSSGNEAVVSDERSLGRVQLAPGETTERDFDLAAAFPGRIVASAQSDGAALGGVELAFLAHDRDGPDRHTQRAARTDASGVAQPAVVFPGAWDVVAYSESERWLHVHAVPVDVAPAARVEVVVALRRIPGTLTCTDASGQALANVELELADGEQRFALSNPLRTDASGRLELTLSSGIYRLTRELPGASPRSVEIRWTEQGPTEAAAVFQ